MRKFKKSFKKIINCFRKMKTEIVLVIFFVGMAIFAMKITNKYQQKIMLKNEYRSIYR